jgi:hypothetical protein
MTGMFFMPTISAQTSELEVEQSTYEKLIGQSITTKFFGYIPDNQKGGRVLVTIISPIGDTSENRIYPTSDGYFELFHTLDKHADVGSYDVTASYKHEIIGNASFDLIDNGNYSLKTQTTMLTESSEIPSWIKNVFIWYGDDKVSEKELLSAIKFLVNDGIINLDS